MSNKIRKNIHIEILKYAYRHREFTSCDLFLKLKFNDSEKNLFTSDLITNKALLQETGKSKEIKTQGESIWTISIDGTDKFREYRHQRGTKRWVIIAIVVAILIAIIFK